MSGACLKISGWRWARSVSWSADAKRPLHSVYSHFGCGNDIITLCSSLNSVPSSVFPLASEMSFLRMIFSSQQRPISCLPNRRRRIAMGSLTNDRKLPRFGIFAVFVGFGVGCVVAASSLRSDRWASAHRSERATRVRRRNLRSEVDAVAFVGDG